MERNSCIKSKPKKWFSFFPFWYHHQISMGAKTSQGQMRGNLSQTKFGIYMLLLLLVMFVPIGQLIAGTHYKESDRSHASVFLISNSVTTFYVLVVAYCKISEKKCECKASNFFCGLSIVPIFVTFTIGFFVFHDFSTWSKALSSEDPKYCHPLIFWAAYVFNICNYLLITGYIIMKILNFFGFGLTLSPPKKTTSIFCCRDVFQL